MPRKPSSEFYQRIYAIVEKIPAGTVTTYGQIAMMTGRLQAARQVGYAMSAAPADRKLPCHRVVNRLGELAAGHVFGGKRFQRMLLEMEGVTFLPDGRIDLKKHLWTGQSEPSKQNRRPDQVHPCTLDCKGDFMSHDLTLSTERLTLRPLRKEDDAPFFAMSADPKVFEFLLPFPDRAASDAFLDCLRQDFNTRGWGFWAVERKSDAQFMGISGMHEPGPEFGVGRPCVEIGWRLAPAFWGSGYATEAARRILCFGFMEVGLPEIVSFAALGNIGSVSVMERLGMRREPDNFDLLLFPPGHPHRTHCLYSIKKEVWQSLNA